MYMDGDAPGDAVRARPHRGARSTGRPAIDAPLVACFVAARPRRPQVVRGERALRRRRSGRRRSRHVDQRLNERASTHPTCYGLRPLRRSARAPRRRARAARRSRVTGRGCARTPRRVTRSTPRSGTRWSSRAGSAIELPEADGGIGLGAVEVAVLAEELGAHAAPAPFVSTVLALDAFARGRRDGVGRAPADRRSARVRRVGPRRTRCRTRRRPTSRSCATTTACSRSSSPSDRAREPAMDLTRELGWLDVDGRPRIPARRRRRARPAPRPGRDVRVRRPARRRRTRARPGRRVRQGPRAVRPPDRFVPGREAPLRRHARRRRGHALDRLLGGVVHRRRTTPTRRSRHPPRRSGAPTRRSASWRRRSRSTAASASRGSTTSTSS